MNPGVEVRIKGQPVSPDTIESVRVEQSLMLPDAFTVQLLPDWQLMKQAEDLLGAEIEILLAAAEGRSLTSVLKGQILALEPRTTRPTGSSSGSWRRTSTSRSSSSTRS